MSIEAAQAFRALIASQPELHKAVSQAIATGNLQSVIDAGRIHGLEFTVDDLQKCVDASELSDTELELVAGGGNRAGKYPEATAPPRVS